MSCFDYKEFTVNACPDAFVIKTLAANTNVLWKLTGKFEQQYTGQATTDAQGILTIPVADPLSQDLFQPFSGAWELRAYTVPGSPVLFCGLYGFLTITFAKITPVPDENNAVIDLNCDA